MKYELDSIDESVVTLDTYNSDLNLVIDASKYSAQPLTKEGFAFMWAGARATHGVIKGRICFEVKVIEHLDVSYLPSDEPNPHVVRVGFSVNSSSLQLGEDPLSYGYGGTGKISTNCQFKDFGPSFVAGDCILAVADLDTDFIQIGFAKNGNFIGWAYKVKKTELEGKALFPHVLTKNCSFEVNFGQRDEPYFKLTDSVKDYTFVGCLPMDERVGGARPPEKREDCEMIMMCGLPGAGKSVWAAEYSQNNPDKKYNVLGTNNIIDKMKVMGLPRKRNYSGRWDVLIQMATKCLNSMFAIGSKLRRNYILDQTNVYPTAQRRKMRNFDGFKRIAVVVVPTEEEYKRRCDKRDREEGKEIPDSAVLEMKANFKLPEVNDVFEEVIFTELQREEAEKLVKLYNEEGKAALGPARKQFRPNEPMKDSKGFDNRKGNFGFNKGDNRGFPGEQGMRGPNTYGISRGDYGRGGFNNRGGFNGGRGGRGGYESGFGGRDNYNMRGGYDNSGNYGDFDNRGGRDGYDTNYSGPRGGFEDHRSGGRSGFEDNYGGYDSSRGGRGGYDGGRGGSRGGYDSGRGGGRGGYDSGRGGGRGGYDSGRGGGRGGYDSGRGGSRGGYDGSSGGSRGGYDGNTGGSRGGYDGSSGGSRGGYEGSRGGGRGGYDGGRGGGRGGYDSGRRGGYEGSRASGRGGSDSSRGSGRGDFDRRDSYNNKRDSYSSYETASKDSSGGNYGAGYGSDRGFDKGSRFEQSGDSFRGDYSASENIPGGTRRGSYGFNDYGGENYSAERFSDKGYGNDSSTEYKRGTSNSRFQSSNRGAASRSGFPGDVYSRDDYSTNYNPGNTASTEGSYSRDYGYSSSYGDYKAQSTTDSYAARDTPSLYSSGPVAKNNDSSQRFTGSNMDTGSKYTQGTRTRWSSDTPQTASSVDTYSAGRSQSYNYPKSDQSAVSYQDKQTYGYQQGMTANTTTQQWMTSSAPSASSPAGYGSAQAQWMQYGQQLPNQYYSQ